MSYILHIDTSGDQGMIMLARSGKLLFERTNTDTRNHASSINLMIEEVLANAAIKLSDLAAIAVCGGPGSYTGLRIGLATAKGICYVNDKALLMHNKLILLALQEQKARAERYEYYGAVLPAREKEYFIGLYNSEGQSIIDARHVFEPELVEILGVNSGKTLLSGLSIKSIVDMGKLNNVETIENQKIDSFFWAAYSFLEYNCNRTVNLASAEPFYLKQVHTHNSKNVN